MLYLIHNYLVPGGFVLTNKGYDNNQSLYGFKFEQWEEIYFNAQPLFKYIFNGLKDIMELFYVPLAKHTSSGGIKILVPRGKKKMFTILKEAIDGFSTYQSKQNIRNVAIKNIKQVKSGTI